MHIAPIRTRPALILAALVIIIAACGDVHSGRVGGITGVPTDTNAVATVTVSPPSLTMAAGTGQTLGATAKTASGRTVSATFSWTTSNSAVATVNASGGVTAVGQGSATISASSGGKSGSASITVTP
jgi:uncharacterized protein YjdB